MRHPRPESKLRQLADAIDWANLEKKFQSDRMTLGAIYLMHVEGISSTKEFYTQLPDRIDWKYFLGLENFPLNEKNYVTFSKRINRCLLFFNEQELLNIFNEKLKTIKKPSFERGETPLEKAIVSKDFQAIQTLFKTNYSSKELVDPETPSICFALLDYGHQSSKDKETLLTEFKIYQTIFLQTLKHLNLISDIHKIKKAKSQAGLRDGAKFPYVWLQYLLTNDVSSAARTYKIDNKIDKNGKYTNTILTQLNLVISDKENAEIKILDIALQVKSTKMIGFLLNKIKIELRTKPSPLFFLTTLKKYFKLQNTTWEKDDDRFLKNIFNRAVKEIQRFINQSTDSISLLEILCPLIFESLSSSESHFNKMKKILDTTKLMSDEKNLIFVTGYLSSNKNPYAEEYQKKLLALPKNPESPLKEAARAILENNLDNLKSSLPFITAKEEKLFLMLLNQHPNSPLKNYCLSFINNSENWFFYRKIKAYVKELTKEIAGFTHQNSLFCKLKKDKKDFFCKILETYDTLAKSGEHPNLNLADIAYSVKKNNEQKKSLTFTTNPSTSFDFSSVLSSYLSIVWGLFSRRGSTLLSQLVLCAPKRHLEKYDLYREPSLISKNSSTNTEENQPTNPFSFSSQNIDRPVTPPTDEAPNNPADSVITQFESENLMTIENLHAISCDVLNKAPVTKSNTQTLFNFFQPNSLPNILADLRHSETYLRSKTASPAA